MYVVMTFCSRGNAFQSLFVIDLKKNVFLKYLYEKKKK